MDKMSHLIAFVTSLAAVFISFQINFATGHPRPDSTTRVINPSFQADWKLQAQEAVKRALKLQSLNTNVAKNVIFFLGDGMGISTVTAGRIYAGQRMGQIGESSQLSFDKFPYLALSKTYNVDHQVPDSAGTATAFLCGEKANLGTIGVNQNVLRRRCDTMAEQNDLDSILRWSLSKGKRAGIVTTTRVTHATPSASYAHVADRDWECDTDIPQEKRAACQWEDIASQLINKNSDINVILGGGRSKFQPKNVPDIEYPTYNGSRTDGRNLIELWKTIMERENRKYSYVWNKELFQSIDLDNTDYLLGLFDRSHMQYSLQKETDGAGEPTLAEMTSTAIKILSRGNEGYFLLVEGGRIDHGHHNNQAKIALSELFEFDKAIRTAVEQTSEDDTLIVVTADHSHVFTMGGYPSRNNPILGFVDEIGMKEAMPIDNMTYVTVMYANGITGKECRKNLSGVNPEADNFKQPSHIPMNYETHGGEDVAVFARGPMSHLFHGVQEQSYIPHAMAYASCVGLNQEHCSGFTSQSGRLATNVLLNASLVFFLVIFSFMQDLQPTA